MALDTRKAIWVWNTGPTIEQQPNTFRDMVTTCGFGRVILKVHDGSAWYNLDPYPPRVVNRLRQAGIPEIAGWGYHYFDEPRGEYDRIAEAIDALQPDAWYLNIEDPVIEQNPQTPWLAHVLIRRVVARMGTRPVYFTSHAQPSYHLRQPYWQAQQAGAINAPMVYHTAMQVGARESIVMSDADFIAHGYAEWAWEPVGAAYGSAEWPITPTGIAEWAAAAIEYGALALSWWSADELIGRPDLWDALGAVTWA